MKHKLDSTGQSARDDSMRREHQRQHIDSLRQITPGVPLIVEGDTLFVVYASLGGEDALHRVESMERKIVQIGKSFRTTTDSIHVFDSELTSDVMCGEIVLVRVSDFDGLWNGLSRHDLATNHARIIQVKIEQLQEEYGLKAKLHGLAWALLLIIVLRAHHTLHPLAAQRGDGRSARSHEASSHQGLRAVECQQRQAHTAHHGAHPSGITHRLSARHLTASAVQHLPRDGEVHMEHDQLRVVTAARHLHLLCQLLP